VAITDRLAETLGVVATMRRAGLIAPMRPDKYVRIAAAMQHAGRLFVVGRDDEMIVSGGESVYPIEVEKTLTAHEDVAEASVIGVDDEQFGQRLAAFVFLKDGAPATPDLLKHRV
jgi:acyl-CoA synthetase (AMP-forming)/AMP-acid ligase II